MAAIGSVPSPARPDAAFGQDHRSGGRPGQNRAVTEQNREVTEQIRALNDRILTGPTATAALLAWCGARGIGAGPIRAVRIEDCAWREPREQALEALGPEAGEALAYRMVHLMRGDVVLARAENWFAAGRLPAPLRWTLQATDMSFGAVVMPLRPSRRTLSVRFTHHLRDHGGLTGIEEESGFSTVLEHEAVLRDRHGRPLCVVHERYGAALVT